MHTASTESVRSRPRKFGWVAFGLVALAGVTSLAVTSGSAAGGGWDAVAVLRDAGGNKVGKVKFEGDNDGTVVKVSLSHIAVETDRFHGFHIHANDLGQPCDPAAAAGPFTNVGGHWNPGGVDHGSHAGDLPTVLVLSDGTAKARSVTGRFAPGAIDGRAVILHAGPDNYANIPTRYEAGGVPGPDAASRGAGDAGGRIACGIIELD
jgi:Cu-Zn family superoxide dismutase